MLLQLSFFSRVELLHTSADILPAVVVSLGLLGGSMTGAVAGFSIGFLVDCLLVAPLGGSSLVLLGAGYLAGLFRERFEIHSALVPPLICMGLTLFAELGFGAVQVMLGVDAPVSALIVRDMLLKSIYAFFLGLADLLRPAPGAAPGPGRGAAGGASARQPTVLGAQRPDVPAIRRARPADGQPAGAAHRGLRRRRPGPLRVLFFRLWLLQVLAGDKYLAEAKNNRTRESRVSAPRGEILDRNGKVLVANRTSLALQVNPRKLPEDPRERRAELFRLAELTHMTLRQLRKTMREELKRRRRRAGDPAPRRRPLPRLLPQENQERFPGVEVQRVFVRRYPHGTSPPTSSATSARSTEEELKEPRYRGLSRATRSARKGSRTPTTASCAAARR